MYKQKYRKSVFIVAYSLEGKEPIYIIQKRKLHWIGWEFPKGGIKKFETKRQTVKREIKEETNLKPIKIVNHKIKGKYKYPKIFSDRSGIIGQSYHLFSVEVKKGKIKFDRREHFSSKWATYKEAQKLLTHKNQKDCLKIVNNYLTKN